MPRAVPIYLVKHYFEHILAPCFYEAAGATRMIAECRRES